jgi:AraC-like DNA-binding protein
MSFAAHVPAAALRPFVAAAHGYRVPANPTGLHRGLPSPHLTLVVELLAPLRLSGPDGQLAAHAVVGGLDTRPAMIDASVPQEGVQYGLTPWGARAFFGVPAGELRGLALDLAVVLGPAATDLVEQLQRATSWTERFGLVDAALLRRLGLAPRRAMDMPPEVTEAWRLLLGSSGRVRVGTVAQEVGWGRRHLSERFRLATGLTPKEAARVARFQAVRGALLAPGRPALVDVALACGYADQQHLAREWRALAGCSISTWLREELPFVQDGAVRIES